MQPVLFSIWLRRLIHYLYKASDDIADEARTTGNIVDNSGKITDLFKNLDGFVDGDKSFEEVIDEHFTVSLEPEEVVMEIDGDKIYCSYWVEEGDLNTEDYKYYEKLVIKDKSGKVLSDEIGSFDRGADGKWWLS